MFKFCLSCLFVTFYLQPAPSAYADNENPNVSFQVENPNFTDPYVCNAGLANSTGSSDFFRFAMLNGGSGVRYATQSYNANSMIQPYTAFNPYAVTQLSFFLSSELFEAQYFVDVCIPAIGYAWDNEEVEYRSDLTTTDFQNRYISLARPILNLGFVAGGCYTPGLNLPITSSTHWMHWSKTASQHGCVLRYNIAEQPTIEVPREWQRAQQRFLVGESIPDHRVITEPEMQELEWQTSFTCQFTKVTMVAGVPKAETTTIKRDNVPTNFEADGSGGFTADPLVAEEWSPLLTSENIHLKPYRVLDSLELSISDSLVDGHKSVNFSFPIKQYERPWKFIGVYKSIKEGSLEKKTLECTIKVEETQG